MPLQLHLSADDEDANEVMKTRDKSLSCLVVANCTSAKYTDIIYIFIYDSTVIYL